MASVTRTRAGAARSARHSDFRLRRFSPVPDEIEQLAARVVAERVHLQRLRERITLCRRDITKLIEAAVENDPAGDWRRSSATCRALLAQMPRVPSVAQLEDLLDELEMLREEIINRLETQIKTQKESGNPIQTERHIQNSKPDSISESEPSFEKKQGANAEIDNHGPTEPTGKRHQQAETSPGNASLPDRSGLKSFPLGLVVQACPTIADYGQGGKIANWRDLMSAAVVVRSMLGVSPSAYQEACSAMGPENAATVMACILERGGHINSAGGYLRDLTRKAERGEFGLGPMLMALLRANAPAARYAG